MSYKKIISIFIILLTVIFMAGCGRITAKKDTSEDPPFFGPLFIGYLSVNPFVTVHDASSGPLTFMAKDIIRPDNNQLTYLWDFGDGNTRTYDSNSIAEQIQHTYTSDGLFYYSLQVSSRGTPAFLMSPTPIKIEGAGAPLEIAQLKVSTVNTTTGNEITFACTTNYDYDLEYCNWDFGDKGSATSGRYAAHTYNTPGQYIVTLRVKKNGQHPGIVRKMVVGVGQDKYLYPDPELELPPVLQSIWVAPPVINDFSFVGYNNAPLDPSGDETRLYMVNGTCKINLTADASDYNNINNLPEVGLSYTWTITGGVNNTTDVAFGSNVIYEFTDPGNYTINLQIANSFMSDYASTVTQLLKLNKKITISKQVYFEPF